MSGDSEYTSDEDDLKEGVNYHLMNINGEKALKMDSNNNKPGSSKGGSVQMPGTSKMLTDENPSQNDMSNAPALQKKKKGKVETMIFEALRALNERNGSSLVAISKYIESNYDVGDSNRFLKNVKRSLKKGLLDSQLILVKRSYKISPAYKQSILENEKIKKKMLLQKEKKKMADKGKKMLPNSSQSKPIKSSEIMQTKIAKSKAKKIIEEGVPAKKVKMAPNSKSAKENIDAPLPTKARKPMIKAIKPKKKMTANTEQASKGSNKPARKSIASLIIPLKNGKKSSRLAKKTEAPAPKSAGTTKAASRKRK